MHDDAPPSAQAEQPLVLLRVAGEAQGVAPNGQAFKIILFHLFTADGGQLVDTQPTGEAVPIVVQSAPIPIARGVVLPTPGVPLARA